MDNNIADVQEAPYAVGGFHSYAVTVKKAEFEALANVPIVNGRGISFGGEKVTFTFDANGRYDSFTTCCPNLAEFKALCGYDLSEVSDHAFVYIHKASQTAPITSAYVLADKDGRLVEFYQRAPNGAFGEPTVKEIDPQRLHPYLETQSPLAVDDAVIERIWWVDKVQGHRLLAPEYPRYLIGMDGKRRWRVWSDVLEVMQEDGFLHLGPR